MVDHRHNWGEDRVYFLDAKGQVHSILGCYTNVAGTDPFVEIAAGRSLFRIEDLIALTRLLEQLR